VIRKPQLKATEDWSLKFSRSAGGAGAVSK